MEILRFIVEKDSPRTVQDFLMKEHGVSRRLLTKLKRCENGITCNGIRIRSIDPVREGDIIVLSSEDVSEIMPNPSLNVPVRFENASLIVFDKSGGMPVHPSIKHQTDTLGNFFAANWKGLTFRPVNRLDKDTSGLVIVAKNAHAASLLQGNFQKKYLAAPHGLIPESGEICAPIARECESIITRCVRDDGRYALTRYKRLIAGEKYSLAEVTPVTGRTHQIRVHFAHIGHPLAGDDLYGGKRDDIPRQALHCCRLSFNDPLDGSIITVDSELPEDMQMLFGAQYNYERT